ncbi:hypothetical protein E0765_10300 [Sulfuricurvum sp. IAE1]|jgi:hypothetical protein|uniref:hypothetical protein n=1 Tax=Sulfuricurvum sp. IAE1 TaxID=2546102 RepID=UPI0010509EA4|nr:hypothetical protein [Sulfuricurvum sp. IAE1]MDX9966160.1 hypothetical protein [Sulfuricurvum sp.]TDA62966.1 hypothetical protein E0765_10300 [Sulfuricurvum sp. IAE1]
MLFDIIKSPSFARLMETHVRDMLIYLFENEQNFGILCKIEHITFDPPLPKHISDEFRAMTLFFLAGYTFESARIDNDALIFEAGFGHENVGSFVTVPLLSIVQVIIDDTPAFVNLALPYEQQPLPEIEKSEGIQNSMSVFLSNPENQKFIKKK